MKNFKFLLLLVLCFSLTTVSNAQLVQGMVAKNLTNTRLVVYGRPNATLTNEKFDNIVITISVPDQSPAANPTITITQNFLPALSWGSLAPFIQGGRAYYVFDGTDATETLNTWNANSNNPILELNLSNLALLDFVQINDLNPGKGGNGKAEWYVQIRNPALGDFGDITNTSAMLYGVGASNTAGRAGPSFAPVQDFGFLPAFALDFNVTKKGTSNALLTWSTSQEQDVSHFILERSYSQITGWSAIGQVKAKGNSGTPTTYTFEDLNVYDGRAASKVVFYRVRAIDLNAAEKIFPIRSIKFTAFGAKEISLYPNPANDGFVISIPIVNPGNNKIRLNMVNRLGQVVHVREISAANATNYFYDLKTPGIISGEYMLQIIYDGELLETKKVIVQH